MIKASDIVNIAGLIYFIILVSTGIMFLVPFSWLAQVYGCDYAQFCPENTQCSLALTLECKKAWFSPASSAIVFNIGGFWWSMTHPMPDIGHFAGIKFTWGIGNVARLVFNGAGLACFLKYLADKILRKNDEDKDARPRK